MQNTIFSREDHFQTYEALKKLVRHFKAVAVAGSVTQDNINVFYHYKKCLERTLGFARWTLNAAEANKAIYKNLQKIIDAMAWHSKNDAEKKAENSFYSLYENVKEYDGYLTDLDLLFKKLNSFKNHIAKKNPAITRLLQQMQESTMADYQAPEDVSESTPATGDESKELHTYWIGNPPDSDSNIFGCDTVSAMNFSKALKSEPGAKVIFWCLEKYRASYMDFFQTTRYSNVEVRSVEKMMSHFDSVLSVKTQLDLIKATEGETETLHDLFAILKTLTYRKAGFENPIVQSSLSDTETRLFLRIALATTYDYTLHPKRSTIRDYVTLKDIFSFVRGLLDGHLSVDATVIPADRKNFSLPKPILFFPAKIAKDEISNYVVSSDIFALSFPTTKDRSEEERDFYTKKAKEIINIVSSSLSKNGVAHNRFPSDPHDPDNIPFKKGMDLFYYSLHQQQGYNATMQCYIGQRLLYVLSANMGRFNRTETKKTFQEDFRQRINTSNTKAHEDVAAELRDEYLQKTSQHYFNTLKIAGYVGYFHSKDDDINITLRQYLLRLSKDPSSALVKFFMNSHYLNRDHLSSQERTLEISPKKVEERRQYIINLKQASAAAAGGAKHGVFAQAASIGSSGEEHTAALGGDADASCLGGGGAKGP